VLGLVEAVRCVASELRDLPLPRRCDHSLHTMEAFAANSGRIRLVRADEVMALIREFVQNLGLDGAACTPESELRSLGIDSLQAVDLVFQLEERFDMQIPMEQFNAKTIGDVIAFVVSLSQCE